MKKRTFFLILRSTCLSACLIACGQARATSYIPPRNLADLAVESDAVVLALAEGSAAAGREGLAFTTTHFVVLEGLSGEISPGDPLQVEVPGGETDGRTWRVAGSPRFRTGGVYLLCLQRKTEDVWITMMLAYGTLREAEGKGGIKLLIPLEEVREAHALPRPDGEPVEAIVPFLEEALLDRLSLVLRGAIAWDARGLHAAPEDVLPEPGGAGAADGGGAGVPAGCTFFSSDGRNWRQPTFDNHGTLTIYANARGDPSESTGGFRRVQEGLDLWMNITRTSYNLLFGGARNISPNCGGHANFILFDDPCSDIADLNGCGGVLAFGGGAAAGTHRLNGETWVSMVNWFVVMNNGVGCLGTGGYRILLAHELGHGLGFGHFSNSSSLMWGTCCHNINATDRSCARYAYPATDPSNVRPDVDAGGSRTLNLLGNSVLLKGTVSDDGIPAPGNVSTTWRHLVGPGTATFEDASALETTVTFPESGTYLLGLVAHDGELLRMDQVQVDVNVFAGSQGTVVFQQNVGGYRGTVDTALLESAPASDNSRASELSVDADDPGGSGRDTQVLLRFEGIFGSGEGQILPGSPIGSAWLELNSTNRGDGAALHRMLETWEDTDRWSTFGGDGVQPSVETRPEADASVVASGGDLVRVDVTKSLAAWSRSPCSNHGWAFLPLGDDGWDFFSAEGDEPPRLVVTPAGFGREKLIEEGDSWEYFKGTRAPPADWSRLGFTPGTGWLTGSTGIGYGDDDDRTTLGDMEGRYPSIFCRREFEINGRVSALTLRVDYDDGFIAYVNGVEAARSASMGSPGSPVSWNDLSDQLREAGAFEEYALDVGLLRQGENVLAVEVHNGSLDSSDLSFVPELVASYLVFESGTLWTFLRGTEPPPPDWNQLGFDDSVWESGRTGLGYGDGDDLTELTDMRNNYLTVFCRKTFTLPDSVSLGDLLLTTLVDDGLVLYVNGVEVERVNMPAGAATWATSASSATESRPVTFTIPSNLLRRGANLLAVSVHNASLDSSDLSFDAVLMPSSGPRTVDCDAGFLRGDVFDDGQLDISDAVKLLFYLFAGGEEVDCLDAADVDDDGEVIITDVIHLLDYLFLAGESPAPPGLECGKDPTADSLPDCVTMSCAN